MSVKLEEERRAASSCDVEHTMGKTEMLGVLDSAEDDWNQSMKLSNTSECERKAQHEEIGNTHLDGLKSSQATRAAKRTHREHQGEPRTPGRSWRSWRTHQNESVNSQNERVDKTHQIDLERGQRSRTTKQSYQAIPRTIHILEASVMSALTE